MKTINQNKQFIFNTIIILLTAYRTTFVKSHLYQQISKHDLVMCAFYPTKSYLHVDSTQLNSVHRSLSVLG